MIIMTMLRHASAARLRVCLEDVCRRSGKSHVGVFLDMALSSVLFGSGYYDYRNFYFDTLSLRQRNEYFTRGRYKKFLRRCHDRAYDDKLESKANFSRLYAEYMRREILDLTQADETAFAAFVVRHPTFFAKPDGTDGGHGIEKIETDADTDISALYRQLHDHSQTVLEEPVHQCAALAAFNPDSVNTYRIVTLVQDGWTEILAGVLRVGAKGNVVDNQCSGGLAYGIDKATGTVVTNGTDLDFTYFKHNPAGANPTGRTLPNWEEACNLCKKAALLVPQINMIGWDIAITDAGPVMIEGNGYPGMDICQMRRTDGTEQGLWRRLEHYYRYNGKIMSWLMETHPLPSTNLPAYVQRVASRYLRRYGNTLRDGTESAFLRRCALAILIAENHQRPWYLRWGEYAIFAVGKIVRPSLEMTLGLAQVRTGTFISYRGSIRRELEILSELLAAYQDENARSAFDEDKALAYLAHEYNHCQRYVKNVQEIYAICDELEAEGELSS